MKSKRFNYDDLTCSSFYQGSNQAEDNNNHTFGTGSFYKNSGCRINTDGAGNIHLVESNVDAKTIDNSMSIMQPFYERT